jgi:MFS family permease
MTTSSHHQNLVGRGLQPRLGRRAALVVVAYAFAVAMFGTTLPTPLYPLYERSIGFGELMVTVVFAVYAIGVLLALYFAGGLSDRVGRRRVLIPALVLSVLSAICFLAEGGLPALFTGRVLSGLSAGLCTGTATATLLDLMPPAKRALGALIATLVNMLGLGLGPLVSGVVSTAFGAPLRVIFVLDIALLVPAIIGLWLIPETVEPTGARPLFTPVQLTLPEQVRPVFVPASLSGFAGFVVLGLFTAVGPAALGEILGVTNRAAVGAVVFAVFASSAAGQVISSRLSPGVALPTGCVILAIGMGLLIFGLQHPSLAGVIAAGVLSGIGQGLSFRAAMVMVTERAPLAQRAAITSLLFIVLYVGISIPVVAVGLGAQLFGLKAAGTVCAAVVALLEIAAAALLRVIRH